MSVTHRDKLVLTLLWKVHVLTLEQIAKLLYPNAKNRMVLAKRLVKGLVSDGLIHRQRFFLNTLPALSEPIHESSPHMPLPDFDALAYRVQSRWKGEAKLIAIYTATPKAKRLYGGELLRVNPMQLDHDVIMGFAYLARTEEERRDWVGEQIYKKTDESDGVKIPDAKLVRGGETYCVIESLGRYDSRRISQFCNYFKDYHHELW